MRLMKRRQRNVALKPRNHCLINANRPVIVRAAMNHAMTDGNKIDILHLPQPSCRLVNGSGQVRNLKRTIAPIDQGRFCVAFSPQTGLRSHAIDLALDETLEIFRSIGLEYLKFEARGACIHDKDHVHCVHSAAIVGMWRRGWAYVPPHSPKRRRCSRRTRLTAVEYPAC